jgi:hypothetical protein
MHLTLRIISLILGGMLMFGFNSTNAHVRIYQHQSRRNPKRQRL